MTTLIACSHGTADAAGQSAVRTLIDQVAALLPDVRVVPAVVDVEHPQIDEVIDVEARHDDVVVVPLLLSVGFHTGVDIADAVGRHANAWQAHPLGSHPLIADIAADRLAGVVPGGWEPGDHVVLAAAGSTAPAAVDDVERAAVHLRELIPVPVSIGYAAAATPSIRDAVAAARAAGASRVIAASHVLAPGFFAGRVSASGADLVSAPLAPDPRLAEIVVERYRAHEASR